MMNKPFATILMGSLKDLRHHAICPRYFKADTDLADLVRAERAANSEKVQV